MARGTAIKNFEDPSPLSRALVGARVLETANNYARASVPDAPAYPVDRSAQGLHFSDDEHFWRQVLADPTEAWNKGIETIDHVIFSEWIARVPGLYWKHGSAALRRYSPDVVEDHGFDRITLKPYGKSQIVIGGVGTLKLPPNTQGYRLGTITMSTNVSAGVPVLVHPDVWNRHQLREGTLIDIQRAIWTQLPLEWSEQFPSTRGHPVGCCLLTDPMSVQVVARNAPTQVHPFTIMSYPDGTAELFDFVFATGITSTTDYRTELENFFESYRNRNERAGRYLIAADIAEPLWDSEFTSPQQLSRVRPSAASHLQLLEERVRQRHLNSDILEKLLKALGALPDIGYLRRISTMIGIEPSTWDSSGSLADAAAQLLARATPKYLAAVIEALAIANPKAFGAA